VIQDSHIKQKAAIFDLFGDFIIGFTGVTAPEGGLCPRISFIRISSIILWGGFYSHICRHIHKKRPPEKLKALILLER
jgi:hypothetical protein